MTKLTRNVFITGASSGIGRACALYLARHGWHVFAGVRRVEDGEQLVARTRERLTPVIMDVTDALSIERAAAIVSETAGAGGLHGLVNNAGIAVGGPLEFLPIEEFREQMEVNVTGQLAVTQAVLPLLRTGQGRIVNMSSMSGRLAVPFLGPYAASKFALEAVSDALRVELQPWDIRVAVIEPGAIKTPIWEKGAERATAIKEGLPPEAETLYGRAMNQLRSTVEETGAHGISPLRVAKAVRHALESKRPKTRYVVGSDARASAIGARFLPDSVMDRLKTRLMGVPGRGS